MAVCEEKKLLLGSFSKKIIKVHFLLNIQNAVIGWWLFLLPIQRMGSA